MNRALGLGVCYFLCLEITDGGSVVFSREPLYDQVDPVEIPLPAPKRAKRDDYYGPSDIDDPNVGDDPSNESGRKSWDVEIRISNEEDQKYSRNKLFIVRFFFTAKSPTLRADVGQGKLIQIPDVSQGNAADDKFILINYMNMGIKNCMIDAPFRSFDKNSKDFFPPGMQLQEALTKVSSRSQWVTPITGLNATTQMSAEDKLFVLVNFCMKWASKEVPILHERDHNILGIEIDLNQPMSDETLGKIHQKLKCIHFHVKYDKGPMWMNEMKAKNKSDDWISQNRWFSKRGTCKMYRSKGKNINEELLATANHHSFTLGGDSETGVGGKEHTVKSYYESKGIQLRFPNLPIVRISKIEWFPIEFLFQGTCAIIVVRSEIVFFLLTTPWCAYLAWETVRVENSPDNVQTALRFHDTYSGKKRIDHTTNLIHYPEKLEILRELTESLVASREKQSEFFNSLSLAIERQPYSVFATCTYGVLHVGVVTRSSISTYIFLC
jgi:hypothetical protein